MHLKKLIYTLTLIIGLSGAAIAQSSELALGGASELKPSNTVKLYPQPATDYLIIKIENNTLKEVEFELFNIIGSPVKLDVEQINDDEFKIAVKELNTGYYMLVVKDGASRYQKAYKFLKK